MKYKAGPAARRRPCFSLSINPLYGVRGSFTQGELEGAKPASNQIKCRAKPCLARRAWSEATIFVPQGGTKITTLFQAAEKVCHSEPAFVPAWESVLFCLRRPLFFQQRKKRGKETPPKTTFLDFLARLHLPLITLNSPRERCAVETSPKCCIVSAPRSAAAFALKYRRISFYRG